MRAPLVLATVLAASPALAGSVTHDLRVTVRPEARSIEVLDTVRFEGLTTPATVHFLLHEGLRPTVTTEGASIALETGALEPSMFLGSPRSIERPESPRVEAWRVRLPRGATALTIRYRGVIHHPLDTQAEEYARGFQETPGIVSAEGVYLASSSWWIPWFGPEPFGFSLEVTLPSGWAAVSEGDADLDVATAEGRRIRFRLPEGKDARVEELHLIAAPFREYAGPAGRVRTMAFLRTPDDALAAKYLEATGPYLEMYEKLLGPYPWGKFALVENFWETGYGMPSFTLLGSKVIRLPFILASSYPHEILHNWWGNGVYVDYARGNWCEGLTAYLADHLFQEQKGQAGAYRQETLQKYADYVSGAKDFPLSAFRERHSPSTEAIGYGKTLMFFHELRRRLGDAAFVAALKDLYASNRFRRASWAEVRASFERVAGTGLEEVFRAAVERTGAPAVRLVKASARPAGDGWILTAELQQTQDGEPYRLRIPVAVTLEGAAAAFETSVELSERRATLEIPLPGRPLRVDVDPDFDLFRRLDREEIPPALSKAFGAEKALVLLPSAAAPELLAGYRAMAETWMKDKPQALEIRSDAEVPALPSDRTVWIVGWENRHLGALAAGLSRYGGALDGSRLGAGGSELPRAGTSGAVVVRHPANPALVAAWVGADRAAAVPGLARKLPHYHKYSYLGFSGDEPTNVLKGRWPVVDSPMSALLADDRKVDAAPRAGRQALAELPPSFSLERMAGTIRTLTAPELAGRGYGEPGSRAAAEAIAAAFREAGLAPGGEEGGYLAAWSDRGGDPEREVRLTNVIGVLRGTDPAWTGQSVVVGAHYDHLGAGWPDAKAGNRGKVHPGADDNASGVAVLVELARSMAASEAKPRRTVVFVAFDAEEAGRRGSKRYVAAGALSAATCIGMVNLDTVGRLGAGKLLVLGAGSASEWVHILNGAGWVTGVPIEVVADDFGSSDQRSFLEAGVPAVQLFTGPHADYHAPSDTAEKIDVAGLAKVAAVAREAVAYLAAREEPLTASGKAPAAASGGGARRVSLGTVPDFAYPGPGLKLSGVTPGSPAEKAGLTAGDIVTAVDGAPVSDLRSFSEILKAHRPGDEVEVVWKRGSEEKRARVALVAR